MKKLLILVALLLPMQAQAFDVDGKATIGVNSTYNFRGVQQTNVPSFNATVDLNTEFVEAGIQGITLQDQKQVEVDAYVGLHYITSGFTGKIGIIDYAEVGADNNKPSLAEYYGGISYASDYGDIALDANYNLYTTNIWYTASYSNAFKFIDYTVGTNFAQYRNAKNEFELAFASVSVNVYKGINLTAEYSYPLKDKTINGTKTKNLASGGISYIF